VVCTHPVTRDPGHGWKIVPGWDTLFEPERTYWIHGACIEPVRGSDARPAGAGGAQ